ncbi:MULTISPECIES: uracil-DNA glycosylase family protein [unclassified Cryobacterium]|uniref:uracil-DNA glycosylase family protein n=1 Tax=unclassified Cryobacterium TaxID=2649013 RepID=UPI002AB4EBEA|nr:MULTISPECIES: uracil-DNA glycosylase family protein [unclassified Cryobacterium]MDY7541332.1 uracil-DNA glycosylase family protein [Cryobacterium sp. 5B3]MEA9998132.1 uracil-DNA glycosylase family protein [Cryobacterium sp. RTS3]MEB0265322.1 uracil-DNA glycosylase family protein [Cryobacterium sp. 10I5]MEB0273369.1 uracil-DNA glycosylase family protein [Cryobacterium sp. 5B3]
MLIKYCELDSRPREIWESLCKTIDNFSYSDQLVFRFHAVIFPLILPTVNADCYCLQDGAIVLEPRDQERRVTIDEIRRAIDTDPANSDWAKRGVEPLFVADPAARIVIIGQAPGQRAQASGIPWDDASGAKLMLWLGVTEAQFREPELFAILPMDFYYPGKGASGDLPPRRDFAQRWHPPILGQLQRIRLTLLVGKYAQDQYLVGRAKSNLTETVRAFREYLPEVFPLVHPSPLNFRWHARNPWFETDLVPVLRTSVADAIV